jgi:hypothetical protein
MRWVTAIGFALAAAAACNGAGRSGAGDGPPAVPDGLTVRLLGVRGVELGWRDRSGGEAWFVVERRGPGKEAFEEAGLRPPGDTVWIEWGLRPDAAYVYRLRAVGPGGRSEPSGSVEVLTPVTLVPEPRVTVFDAAAMSPGATLFNVEDYHDVAGVSVLMAVDEAGAVLWHLEYTGQLATETDLYPNGDILAQVGPAWARIDRKGDLVDHNDQFFVHHDVDILPWGNVLAITSLDFTAETGAAADAYSRDHIIEVDPETGMIAWRLAFDMLIGAEEICRACIGTEVVGGLDWIHLNALDYDLEDEALYVSVRNLNRIYKLSFPEGEVEWIMGDGGDFGEGLFTHQHNPYRLKPGRMLIFDNGLHPDPFEPDRSRVIEIEYDPGAREARVVWEYAGPPAFYSEAQGDATRLVNGNTLIVDSARPRLLEITHDGLPVWELTLPKPYIIYKAHRIENFP